MKKLTLLITAATLAASSVAMAANSTTTADNSGVFASALGGYGNVNLTRKKLGLPNTTKLDNSNFAWDVNFGYEFNKYLAVEAGYLQAASVKNVPAAGNNQTKELEFGFYTADAKAMYPATSELTVFAKAGAGYSQKAFFNNVGTTTTTIRNSDTNAFVVLAGAGVDYALTNKAVATVEALHTFENGKISDEKFTPSTWSFLAGFGVKF